VAGAKWNRAAMLVSGRAVQPIGVPFEQLKRFKIPAFDICDQIFAHHVYYSSETLFRDVPDFQPRVTLEAGIASVLEAMERDNRIPTGESNTWEDAIIEKQKEVGT